MKRPDLDGLDLPATAEVVDFIRSLDKPSVVDVLRAAASEGEVALQPRCGVGGHDEMLELLLALESSAQPDILTLTIDSHTRLNRFDLAEEILGNAPQHLNGYPLVAHGWSRGRELNHRLRTPIEVRHGSPQPYALFEVSIAAGLTSFEGGGISYNLPYSKDVPLIDSLAAYRYVDGRCGELADAGVIVDRELFGTLTAVLVPPSISLAISVLEALAAAREGVRCVSISYPQGGNVLQDIAALRAIPDLARRYLPSTVEVYSVLHEFMGAFPQSRQRADALIFLGALVARLGGATKLITKTHQEAYGIPDAAANVDGIRTARIASSVLLDFVTVNEAEVAEEKSWIEREVHELVEPVLEAGELHCAIAQSFLAGRLDVPFSASRHARSDVLPRRDASGAIRYFETGGLPFSADVRKRNLNLLESCRNDEVGELLRGLTADIGYFAEQSSDVLDPASPLRLATDALRGAARETPTLTRNSTRTAVADRGDTGVNTRDWFGGW